MPKKRNLEIKNAKIKFFDIFNSQNSTKVHEKFLALDIWFKSVAKNIEGCLKDLTFIFIFVASQIWLNLLMDDWHFGYITKFTKKNTLFLIPISQTQVTYTRYEI